jgi:hypothetical protein
MLFPTFMRKENKENSRGNARIEKDNRLMKGIERK